uniref:MAK10-like protein n=1 Tax=Tanacetum cinerariifolium TaxID=118510 RepID=A0A6L2N0T1_TANCI|nr:MAK10-like protein [Tanacetum cinerariifolium]
MRGQNPICTLRDYSNPSHEGYMNTIELPVGNNVAPLRSDTIQLVQNECSFHELRSEDPNQHLKDFLKVVDSFDLDGENREKNVHHHMGGSYYPIPCLILSIGKDRKNSAMISSCSNNIMENLYPKHGLISRTYHKKSLIMASTFGSNWNGPRDFAKSVKAIALPQDVPSTSDRRLIKLKNQVQRLMEAHLAPTQPTQVNKITTPCEICGGPHDTQYCMENHEQAFVEYTSSHTDKAGAITDRIVGTLPSDLKLGTHTVLFARSYPVTDPQCSSHSSTSINTIKAYFNDAIIKPQQTKEPEPTLNDKFKDLHLNLLVLKVSAHASIYNVILDKYVEQAFVEYASSRTDEAGGKWYTFKPEQNNLGDTYNPSWRSHPNLRLEDSKPFDTLADLGSCLNIIPLYLFKKLNIRLLEDTDHIFGWTNRNNSYPIGIFKDVEVYIRKLKTLNDFYVIDMKKDPETPLLVGRGFLATANTVIYCRIAKIAIGEGITRSIFGVKGVDLGKEEATYWTTLGKRDSFKPRPHSDGIGTQTPYYARKEFLYFHLPREWEIARDADLNPFKDTLVFRRMDIFDGKKLGSS